MRGIGLVFQLEEGETLTEPVPSRENRRAILAYEATEGGAGVLGRLTSEPQALARVARTALELMHYRNLDETAILDRLKAPQCEISSYRLQKSYCKTYRQHQVSIEPDHKKSW